MSLGSGLAEILAEKGVPVFFNVQQFVFCVLQANIKLCYNFARNSDDSISWRYLLFHGKKSTFQNNIQKSHLFTIASLAFYI